MAAPNIRDAQTQNQSNNPLPVTKGGENIESMEAVQTESILKQFELVEASIERAKMPFWSGMLHKNVVEVSLWELMKAREQIENMIREIAPERFGAKHLTVTQYYVPKLEIERLHLCTICGSPECQSDHK